MSREVAEAVALFLVCVGWGALILWTARRADAYTEDDE
jgi:hypothetical protein